MCTLTSQHGEYYGFSVVALDLNGDGYVPLFCCGFPITTINRSTNIFMYSIYPDQSKFLTIVHHRVCGISMNQAAKMKQTAFF